MSERIFSSPPGTTIVARDALQARQWEALLAQEQARQGARAWRTPSLLGYGTWLAEEWSARDRPESLLTRAQSQALWRRLIGVSAESRDLIDIAAPAEWAAQAWRLLAQWQIDPQSLRAGRDQPDFRAFLQWSKAYAEALATQRWRDAAGLEDALEPPALDRLILADVDLEALAPSERRFVERITASGTGVTHWQAPSSSAAAVRVGLPNEQAELEAALDWAAERLCGAPARRVALVVPDLDACRPALERGLATRLDPATTVWDPHGTTKDRDPAVGSALAGIELMSPAAAFPALSYWLRSVPLDDPRSGPWAVLESTLRRELIAQLGVREAYRRGGLRARVHATSTELATGLDIAIAEGGAPRTRRSPSEWTAAWQRGLRALGWPLGPVPVATHAVWENALAELRRLTPVLGPIGESEAREELERIVAERRQPAPLPLAGLAILERIEDVGPGYDCAWVAGFTDAHWPRPARLNPLLPRRLQQAHGMPWSSPHDALARSERSLHALLTRVPEVVMSWPQQLLEQPTEPSPLITHLPERSASLRSAAVTSPAKREQIADRPAPLPTPAIRGGAAALNLQARAPLRAFIEHRLGAQALEPFAVGLSQRLRGIATHRALERWYGPPRANAATVADCAANALEEVFGSARDGMEALFRLEHERLTALLDRFVAVEAARAPFAIEAVEARQEVRLAGHVLRVRIDRVDRLADGQLAVLDYKTGPASAGDWLRERPRDVQVPLYAVHLGSSVGAVVLVTLDPAEPAYQGIWPPGAFPSKPRALERDWQAQLRVWREQLEQLATELASGDCRVFLADLDPVRGAYAPLTRVYEQLKLHRADDVL